MKITQTCRVVEVGRVIGGRGHSEVLLSSDIGTDDMRITGLTYDEAKAAAQLFGQPVTVTIEIGPVQS